MAATLENGLYTR